MAPKLSLTYSQEQSAWFAVYAAAWVEDFRRIMEKGGASFDRAAELDHAEQAITLADLAIAQLRASGRTGP
jgi:hypothetical protein